MEASDITRAIPPTDRIAGEPEGSPAAVRLTLVSKVFPGIRALREVSLSIEPGEIHGLVGENGAGKSTLAKIVSGALPADQGRVEIAGSDMTHSGPREVALSGVAMVYQDPSVIPELSAAANAFLGNPVTRGLLLAKRERARRFAALAQQLDIQIDPGERAGSLTVAKQRLLAVIAAVLARCRLLIMDEPTASLGPVERQKVFDTIARLQRSNVTIIYISHDLDEVLALCDRVSVMRDGSLIATRRSRDWTAGELVRHMLGREVAPAAQRCASQGSDEVLGIAELTVPGALRGVSVSVRPGEILGVAGLLGAGRSTLLRAIAGAEPAAGGTMRLRGQEVPWPRSVRAAISRGIVLSPEDRKGEGLILSMSCGLNVALTNMRAVSKGPIINRKRLHRRSAELLRRLGFNVDRLGALAGTLSGGNQQKLVVAKCMNRDPTVLLLDEPTSGIDVGAKADVFAAMVQLAESGKAIIFTSSEIEEVIGVSNRVLVLAAGRQTGLLEEGELTVERVLQLAFRLSGNDSSLDGGGGE